MPFNLETLNWKPIDYEQLKEAFIYKHPLSQFKNSSDYFSEWFKFLSFLDVMLHNELLNDDVRLDLQEQIKSIELEYYQYKIPVDGQFLTVNFNISSIWHYLEQNNYSKHIKKIPCEEFNGNSSKYIFNSDVNDQIKPKNINRPILILPLENRFIVIDGNHRIKKLKDVQSTLEAIILPKGRIENISDLFITKHDQATLNFISYNFFILQAIQHGGLSALPNNSSFIKNIVSRWY